MCMGVSVCVCVRARMCLCVCLCMCIVYVCLHACISLPVSSVMPMSVYVCVRLRV